MELPTYTNIWKIEKRLYKLYDFRLPMPLPVGQVAAFLLIAVPYMLILTMVGMPFSHTWLWLYVLPPGLLAWLVTRPVLEGKRLPELVTSQLRYLAEPRTWCRMTPVAERDDVALVARVWRAAGYPRTAPAELQARSAQRHSGAKRAAPPQPGQRARPVTPPARIAVRDRSTPERAAAQAAPPRPVPAARIAQPATVRPAWPVSPLQAQPARSDTAQAQPARSDTVPAQPVAEGTAPPSWPAAPRIAPGTQRQERQSAGQEAQPAAVRPAVRVSGDGAQPQQLNVVERALRTPPGAAGRRGPVVVVPGGHRPGRPDQVQRDQARAAMPLPGPARIVVLGCTAGAGQTTTTLLTGQLLASLRGEAVAVLDLGHGEGSLTERARLVPLLLPGRRTGGGAAGNVGAGGAGGGKPATERGLQVVTASGTSDDPGDIIDAVVARYPLTLADPDSGCVPRTLRAADQLILVAPASAEAAGALAMTMEWLEAHDHSRLGAGAITVLNGVSQQTTQHVDKAAAVASGRCRAIVRVPWDERLAARQALGAATVQAYTALAGVVVVALAEAAAAAPPARSEVQ